MGLGAAAGAKNIAVFFRLFLCQNAAGRRSRGAVCLWDDFYGETLSYDSGRFCVGALSDDFLEVRTDVLLNEMIPSGQRATLISVNSFLFSMVMIVMSALMGWIMG